MSIAIDILITGRFARLQEKLKFTAIANDKQSERELGV